MYTGPQQPPVGHAPPANGLGPVKHPPGTGMGVGAPIAPQAGWTPGASPPVGIPPVGVPRVLPPPNAPPPVRPPGPGLPPPVAPPPGRVAPTPFAPPTAHMAGLALHPPGGAAASPRGPVSAPPLLSTAQPPPLMTAPPPRVAPPPAVPGHLVPAPRSGPPPPMFAPPPSLPPVTHSAQGGRPHVPPPPLFTPPKAQPPPLQQHGGPPASPPGVPPPPPLGGVNTPPKPSTPPASNSGGSSGARIDPAQIPRPSYSPPGEPVVYDTRAGGAAVQPPSACMPFVARDTGNCSPRFVRLSIHALPSSSDLGTTSGMPLCAMLQPLALPGPGELPVPVVDPGPDGPVRCAKCKAYMCPFHRWTEGGRAWVCGLCGTRNDVRNGDLCHLAADGTRIDAPERPEFSLGSVEYAVGDAYCSRPPQTAAILAVIDGSPAAQACGFTASCCDALKRALATCAGGDAARVGLVAVDGAVRFFRWRQPGDTPLQLLVADTEQPYAPSPGGAGLLAPLGSHRGDLEALLDAMPALLATSPRGPECVIGAAICAAVDALSGSGGRVIVFCAGSPTAGWGALPATGAARGSVADGDPLRSCAPADKAYIRLAGDAAERCVGVDLFIGGSACGDGLTVPTLGPLALHTGGTCTTYAGFTPSLDFGQLCNDVRWGLARPQAHDAVMRMRVSAGARVESYSGPSAIRAPQSDDVDLPCVDCDKAVMANLVIDDRRNDGAPFVAQCAMLFTTPQGQRRIRVHTLCVPVAGALAALFRGADMEVQLAAAQRKVAEDLLLRPAKFSAAALRERATSDAVTALHAYRRYCAANSAAGQLILPEALKLLPLYTLGLTKSAGLRVGALPDDRCAWALRVMSTGAAAVVPSCYPRLFEVTRLGEQGADGDDGSPALVVPGSQWLSSERLDSEGIHLVEDGATVLLHVAQRAPPARLAALFGTADGVTSATPVPALRTPQSCALHALLDALRTQRGAYMRLRVVRRPDAAAETTFFAMLIEDRSMAGMSYVEYLCHVHRLIQARYT